MRLCGGAIEVGEESEGWGVYGAMFVAMGWRQTQSAEALAALLNMMQFDRDRNVPAEAANSLSMFGSEAIAHFVAAFRRDDNLLVRHSAWLGCAIGCRPKLIVKMLYSKSENSCIMFF
ncbi:HEAT repeat domain-containing protein [Microcoleus sp. Pol10D4]|uniref:HEAT repeat domain-containing protein n=1 Tax=Microcoleus sp. Pol10D4 TaxID=3055387 RepID=UPI002FD6964B